MVKLHKEFRYIYNKAKSFHSKSIVLFYLPNNNLRKVGFTATKKIGNAVKRNKAKRRMRALFIQNADKLCDGTYIFVAKEPITTLDFKIIQKDFKYIIRKANAFKK
ncbi:MAG: ribonuclease P protein component [Epsilonproteobacteria bacterium]|nr:ribonuclease P protein component [Campylobacterota bacterium]